MFDLFKRRKGRGARRRATPSMFAEFLEYFGEAPVLEDGAADPYDAFIDGLGGRSFGDGVFRVFERSDLERWHRVVSGCFTKLRGEFNLIGYDWMGRCFAVDQRDGDGKELVVLLEIATLDMYYIGKDVAVFLNEVMPNQSEAWGREVSGVAGGACARGTHGMRRLQDPSLPRRGGLPGEHGGLRHGGVLGYD